MQLQEVKTSWLLTLAIADLSVSELGSSRFDQGENFRMSITDGTVNWVPSEPPCHDKRVGSKLLIGLFGFNTNPPVALKFKKINK